MSFVSARLFLQRTKDKGLCYDAMLCISDAETCFRKALNLCSTFESCIPDYKTMICCHLRKNLIKQEKIDALLTEFKLSPLTLLLDAVECDKYTVIEKLLDLGANPFSEEALDITANNSRLRLYFLSYFTDKKYKLTDHQPYEYKIGENEENEKSILEYIDKICSSELKLSINLTNNQMSKFVSKIIDMYQTKNSDNWLEYDCFKHIPDDLDSFGHENLEACEQLRHSSQLQYIEELHQKEKIKHMEAMKQISNIKFLESLNCEKEKE